MPTKNKNIKSNNNSRNQILHWIIFLFVSVGSTIWLLGQIKGINNFNPADLKVAQAAAGPSLSLSPTSAVVTNGQNITINILLNTASLPTSGVDILSLHFNPAILQVVDDNTSLSGVQITAGNLLPVTVINSVDQIAGTIQFSQASSGGTNFTGSGTLATIHFHAIAGGTSAITFDFTPGSTVDTNIAYQGTDELAAVTNASITVNNLDTTPPTVSISAPTNGSTVSGSAVTVSASASDGIGVVGVQFKLDGSNLGAEDTSLPYSVTWNTTLVSNASHSITAVARDAAGNTKTSSAISVTVNNAPLNRVSSGSLDEINPAGLIRGWSFDPDSTTVSNQVKIYIDGPASSGTLITTVAASIDRPDIRSSYSITGNHGFQFVVPTIYQDGRYHSVYVYGVDTSSVSVTSQLTNSGKSFTTKTIGIDQEALLITGVSGTFSVLNTSKASLKDIAFTTNASGQFFVTLDISAQTVYFKVSVPYYLTRLLSNIDLGQQVTGVVAIPKLFAGDLNNDNIINSIDYSILNTHWFTSHAISDINHDGVVNSVDFSFMNLHWLVSGEQ